MTISRKPTPAVRWTPAHRRTWRTLWRRCSCGLTEPCIDRLMTPTDETVATQPTMDRAAQAAGLRNVLHHVQEVPAWRETRPAAATAQASAAARVSAAPRISAADADRSAGADQWPTNLLGNAATVSEPGAAQTVDLMNSAAELAARAESCRSAFDLVTRAAEMALLKEPVTSALPATRPADEPVPVGEAIVVSGREDAEQLFARLLAIMKTEYLLNAAAMPSRIVPPLGIFSCDGPGQRVTRQDSSITITTRRTRRAEYVGTASVATPRSGTTARTGTAATADHPRGPRTDAALTGSSTASNRSQRALVGVACVGSTGPVTRQQRTRAGTGLAGGSGGASERPQPTRVAVALGGSAPVGEWAPAGIEVGRAGNLTPAQADRAAYAEGLRGGRQRPRPVERPAWREFLPDSGGGPQSGQAG